MENKQASQVVSLQKKKGVAFIALNRPDKRNALNSALISGISSALSNLAHDSDVRAIVITGKGKTFCAGGDLQSHPALWTNDAEARDQSIRTAQAVILGIRSIEVPIIAAINGDALGAGLDLAMACDLRIASEGARFAATFSKIGLVPDMGGTYFLPRVVGIAKTLEMLLTGGFVSAQEAAHLGLVNRVVASRELLRETAALAEQLASGPTQAYRLLKKAVYSHWQMDIKEALEEERRSQNFLIATDDVREGIAAFLEKRVPAFKGR